LVKFRYQILAPTAVAGGFVDGKKASEMLLDAMQLEKASYRVGTSKVNTNLLIFCSSETFKQLCCPKVMIPCS